VSGESVSRWHEFFLAPPAVSPVAPGPRPTFSVVIAAYQVADVIHQAIESALAQTVPAHEIVVCDDGSTDDLERALAPYRDRILLLRKEHGGEASAKNAAISAASGDFVVILDADDVFAPERLDALGALAVARPDLDILTTDAYLETDAGVVRRCYTRYWRFETVDQRRGILERNFILGLAAVRRTRLLEQGGFDESILWTTDWECWIRMIFDGSRVGAVMQPLARYRVRETSLSAQRAQLVQGKIRTLDQTSASIELTDTELQTLRRALAAYRRELALAEARDAAASDDPSARQRALSLIRARHVGLRARLTAAAIAGAPKLSGRMLRRLNARSWVGAGGVRVRRRARPAWRASPTAATAVAVYSDSTEIGGAELSLRNLVANVSSGVEITVLGIEGTVVERIASAQPGAKAVVLHAPRGAFDLRALSEHVRVLRSLRPQVLHVNLANPWAGNYAFASARLLKNTTTIAVYQLLVPPTSRRQRLAKRAVVGRVDVHVGVGESTSRGVERLLGLPERSVKTVFNGVSPYELHRDQPRSDRLTIGSVGRLEHQKGYDVLLRALVQLPDAVAVIVGEGSERQRLESLAHELRIAERISWTGWSEEPRKLLALFDVFVLPSRSEGFPLSIVEAMLAELPVVATDVGSVREAVVPEETGVLVAPEQPELLAEALGRVLGDPELRGRLGARGRELALERFTAAAMARSFEELYSESMT
jgi:glycosyltransferase involved in cell wall biosynthesis